MCISAFIAYGKWFLQFPGSDTGLEIGSSKPWPAVKPYPPDFCLSSSFGLAYFDAPRIDEGGYKPYLIDIYLLREHPCPVKNGVWKGSLFEEYIGVDLEAPINNY